MAWIEVHQAIFRHRKTFVLAAELGIGRVQAGGHVISLWLWALDNAPDGDLSALPEQALAFGAEWEGDAQRFAAALVKAGFVDRDVDRDSACGWVVLHDWNDYAGRLIEKRQGDADRKRRWREQQGSHQGRSAGQTPRSGQAQMGQGRPVAAADVSRGRRVGQDADAARCDPEASSVTVPNRTVPYPTVSSGEITGDSETQDIRRDSHDDSEPVEAAALPPPPATAAADGGDDPQHAQAIATPVNPPRLRTVYGEESEAMQLAREFGRGLRSIKPDVKLPKQADGWQSWAREFDLMLRVDHRPREKVEAVMAYARRSSFWRSVVLAPRSLRDKFDRLDIQREEDANGRVSSDRRRAERGYAAGPARGRGSGAGAGSQQRSYPKLDASYYDRVRERERERERSAAASGE